MLIAVLDTIKRMEKFEKIAYADVFWRKSYKKWLYKLISLSRTNVEFM